jgi:hypothetical protein
MRRWLPLALALLFAPLAAGSSLASEGAYLSGEDLAKVSPAFEAFVESLADVLVARGLLAEDEREAWELYQRGDFLQNGGFGTIAVMYTPGLMSVADDSVMMRELSAQTSAGTVWLETLRSYSVANSPLPGLPLDAELRGEGEEVRPCRFRWIASGGSFLIWDGGQGGIVNVGATYIGDGRPLYWFMDPVDGIAETLTLELLHPDEDRTLASVTLDMRSGEDFWMPEALR